MTTVQLYLGEGIWRAGEENKGGQGEGDRGGRQGRGRGRAGSIGIKRECWGRALEGDSGRRQGAEGGLGVWG